MTAISQTDLERGRSFLEPARSRMRLLSFRPLIKASLRGFAELELACGLRIRDIPVLVGRNGAWANLPAKPQVDKDGHVKTDVNGKITYSWLKDPQPGVDFGKRVRFAYTVNPGLRDAGP